MRMLALAQVAEERGSVVLFICAEIPDALRQRLEREGFRVEMIDAKPGSQQDIECTLDLARRYLPRDASAKWIVTDGYSFAYDYQYAVRASGYRLLVVDDYNHLPFYDCDILLNQNIGAEALPYNVSPSARRLLGPRYVMLRREFREAIRYRDCDCRTNPHDKVRLLVTMGGADTQHMTKKVLHALSEIKDIVFHVRAVVGAAYPQYDALLAEVPSGPHRIECLRDVADMPALMRWADLAVTAAGSTCWELLAMGVPTAVVIVAENQANIGRLLVKGRFAVDLGCFMNWSDGRFADALRGLTGDLDLRSALSNSGRSLVDGCGPVRVFSEIEHHETRCTV